MMRVTPVEPPHAEAVAQLLAVASRGCFCRWWHYPGDDLSWQGRCNLEPEVNRAELVRAIERGDPDGRGIVALEGLEAVGWLKLCPAPAMAKLRGRRLYRSLDCFEGDRSGVMVIGCVTVHPERRREGIARALLAGAIEAAREAGATTIEALPRRSDEALRDDELWMGPLVMYEEQGFEVVGGPRPYPVLRRRL